MCVWLGRREGRGGMEWNGREGRKRAVERGRKEENRSSGKWGEGGRGMGSRNQEVMGTSVKVHHRGQRAPIRV